MYKDEAIKKLEEEAKAGKFADSKAKAMKNAVKGALQEFCRQDEEFAQAVVQGGSFEDCMKKVAAGVGNCISDIDAFKKAVQYYFAGAEISVQMAIDVCPNRVGGPVDTVILSLDDFM